MSKMTFEFPRRSIHLDKCHVMGILNVTPDSFSDGGKWNSIESALRQAESFIELGASFIDIGGESTRPGAEAVSLEEELSRVIPVIEAINTRFDTLISIDTYKPEVMVEAASAGASLINDVFALQKPKALQAAASTGLPVCLMHMQGTPKTMQKSPTYADIFGDLQNFFAERVSACNAHGISKDKIMIDPGFGFGKTVEHNYHVLNRLGELRNLGFPILSGTSRKSMLGAIIDKPAHERIDASVASAVIAAMNGASIVRVHDVEQTIDAIKVVNATAHGVTSER